MGQNDVLDKVRKLLAKAEATVGTPESETFEAKAFELIAKYGIDESAARAKNDGTADASLGQLIATSIKFPAPYAGERMMLFYAIAQALHCDGIRMDKDTIKLFGVRVHVERVKFLYALLQPQMMAGASKALPDDPFDRAGGGSVRKHRADWMLGFGATIRNRLKEAERKAADQYDSESGGSGAEVMLVSDLKRAQDALNRKYPNRSHSRGRRVGSGFSDGNAAGRSADIGNTRIGKVRQAISS